MHTLQEQVEVPEKRACESQAHPKTQETEERTPDKHPVKLAKHELQEGNGTVYTAD